MQNEIVIEWVKKAEEDYKAASYLLPKETPYVICFHAQQCIEKYLKAFLIMCGETPPQTHNLIRLNSIASEYNHSLDDIYSSLEELNPYSVPIRYPGISVTEEDAKTAILTMKNIRDKLRELISNIGD